MEVGRMFVFIRKAALKNGNPAYDNDQGTAYQPCEEHDFKRAD